MNILIHSQEKKKPSENQEKNKKTKKKILMKNPLDSVTVSAIKNSGNNNKMSPRGDEEADPSDENLNQITILMKKILED